VSGEELEKLGDASRAEFEQRTRAVLEDSVSRLDGRTRSRLTQARYAALEQGRRSQRLWWRAFAPAGAVAAAAVLAIALWVGRPGLDAPLSASQPFDDLELLADNDAFDLAEDSVDLDFYEWAAAEAGDADADGLGS
jgi:anti-sigma-K factor RskA